MLEAEPSALFTPVTLPCGATLPNRVAKAAMTEGLSKDGRANQLHATLYRRWATGGAGLLLTGNVIVDRRHLERPGNVVIDGEPDAAAVDGLRRWARAAHDGGARIWLQLSHSGRQTPARVNAAPKAPSAIPVALPGKQFATPIELTEAEIRTVIKKFATAARVARETGFDGVQLHGAHGYLISQFLSPRSNRRDDVWGGSLDNRARLLLDAVRATRVAVGADFPVAVKLNSADFQKGGFGVDDSLIVAGWLQDVGVDLLEISGGSYEQPKMMNVEGLETPDTPRAHSTRRREVYFLEFAETMLAADTPPLMVTGGFRSRLAMEEAIAEGISVVGVGRPLTVDPNGPNLLKSPGGHVHGFEQLRLGPGLFGPASSVPLLKAINGFATQSWYYQQIRRLADGRNAQPKRTVVAAFLAEKRADRALLKSAAPSERQQFTDR